MLEYNIFDCLQIIESHILDEKNVFVKRGFLDICFSIGLQYQDFYLGLC